MTHATTLRRDVAKQRDHSASGLPGCAWHAVGESAVLQMPGVAARRRSAGSKNAVTARATAWGCGPALGLTTRCWSPVAPPQIWKALAKGLERLVPTDLVQPFFPHVDRHAARLGAKRRFLLTSRFGSPGRERPAHSPAPSTTSGAKPCSTPFRLIQASRESSSGAGVICLRDDVASDFAMCVAVAMSTCRACGAPEPVWPPQGNPRDRDGTEGYRLSSTLETARRSS